MQPAGNAYGDYSSRLVMQLFNPQEKAGNSHLACHSFMPKTSFHTQQISTEVQKGHNEGTQRFRSAPKGFDFFNEDCLDRKYFLPCNNSSLESAKQRLSEPNTAPLYTQ